MRMLREKSDAGRADRTPRAARSGPRRCPDDAARSGPRRCPDDAARSGPRRCPDDAARSGPRRCPDDAVRSAGRQAGWAAAYLLVAGGLIAIAGTELSGPSPEARARALEHETARELAAVVETASAVARSRFEEDRRRVLEREKGREATLRAALAGVRSWARQLESPIDDADVSPGELSVSKNPFSLAAADLAPLLPHGVVAAIVAPSGEKLFEAGGELDLDSPRALMAPLGGGFTAAVDCPGGTPPADCGFAGALRETLRRYLVGGLAPGTGLYFVSEDGCVVAEVSARPTASNRDAQDTQDVERQVSCPSCPSLLNAVAVRGVVKSVAGDLETGRLVSARRPVGLSADSPKDDPSSVLAWTAVAERFLSPDALAAGPGDLAGTLALTGLGVVAAAAFAHAFYAGFAKGPPSTARPSPPRRQEREGRQEDPPPLFLPSLASWRSAGPRAFPRELGESDAACAGDYGGPSPGEVSRGMTDREAEPVPQGRSIVRLRESLGVFPRNDTGALGSVHHPPPLAACARSPILRALSRCVRHPGPAFVPREVKEWARQAFVEEGGHRNRKRVA